jgi:hypothetical protein
LKKAIYILIVGLLHLAVQIQAQHITSIGVSNYAKSQSMFLSPSLSGYSKYNWHVNLVGAWANVNNNYLGLRVPYSLYRVPNRVPEQYRTPEGNLVFEKDWIHESINGRRKNVSAAASVFGPSFSLNLGKLSIGMLSSGHAGVRAVGISENLAHALYHEMDSAQGAFDYFNTFSSGRGNTIDDITLAGHTHASVGLNLAYAIPLKWDRQLIPGINIKRSFGYQGFAFKSNDLVMNTNGIDSLYIEPTEMDLYYYGEGETAKTWSFDLGMTYVFHKKEFQRSGPYLLNKTQYHSKFTIAILDIGNFNYTDAYQANLQFLNTIPINTDSFDLEINENNYERVLDSFVDVYGSYSARRGALKIGMPTRIVLSTDMQIKKHFFVSATLTQSLRSRKSIHMRHQNTLMLAPRWEHPYFELSTPLLWAYDYRSVRLGLSARLGPLYFGTNSVLPFLYTRGFRDADIFVGIAFGNIPNYGLLDWINDRKEKREARRKARGCATF